MTISKCLQTNGSATQLRSLTLSKREIYPFLATVNAELEGWLEPGDEMAKQWFDLRNFAMENNAVLRVAESEA